MRGKIPAQLRQLGVDIAGTERPTRLFFMVIPEGLGRRSKCPERQNPCYQRPLEPGLQPAPQLPVAKAVDEILTCWYVRMLAAC